MENHLEVLIGFCQKYAYFVQPSILHNEEFRNDNTDYLSQAKDMAKWIEERANDIFDKLSENEKCWNYIVNVNTVDVYNIQGFKLYHGISLSELRGILPKGCYIIGNKVKYVK